jgi:hypothetical protein
MLRHSIQCPFIVHNKCSNNNKLIHLLSMLCVTHIWGVHDTLSLVALAVEVGLHACSALSASALHDGRTVRSLAVSLWHVAQMLQNEMHTFIHKSPTHLVAFGGVQAACSVCSIEEQWNNTGMLVLCIHSKLLLAFIMQFTNCLCAFILVAHKSACVDGASLSYS